jgi:hypothetical protein
MRLGDKVNGGNTGYDNQKRKLLLGNACSARSGRASGTGKDCRLCMLVAEIDVHLAAHFFDESLKAVFSFMLSLSDARRIQSTKNMSRALRLQG